MICQARGSAKEWPAVCSGVSQQQQVFTLGEDEGEAAIPASPRRQLWQIQDLLAFHDRLAATLQKHQLVRGRWGIVAHEQTTLCCQQQKPLLPLFENKSTCGEGERRKKKKKEKSVGYNAVRTFSQTHAGSLLSDQPWPHDRDSRAELD